VSDFEVDLGDGRSIVVDAPNAQEAAGAARKFLATEKGRGDAGRSKSDNVAQAFGQGAALGFGDELTAGVRAAAPGFSNWMMSGPALQRDESIGGSPTPQTVSTAPTMQGRYDEELARERAKAARFHETNPYLATGANIAGAVATTALAMPSAVTQGGGLIANSLRGAATGAKLGGIQGFGEGEGGFDARMQNATKGAAFGGALGGAFPAVGSVLSQVYQRAAPPILNKVADVAERYVPKVGSRPLSAAAPDGGQVAGDSLATRLADNARIAAGGIEGDAATSRLALELSRSGGTRQAGARLADLGDEAFIADTSKGAQRLANVGYILPGEAADKYAAAFGARNKGTGTRFEATLPDSPSVADTQRFFDVYKRQTGSDLYDPVLRAGKPVISADMLELAKVPAIRDALAQIAADAERHGVKLTVGEQLHLVKQTLNANTDAAFQSGKAINKNMVAKAGDAWEAALYKANPKIQAADEAYANISSLSNKKTGEGLLERGQNFMRAGTSDEAVAMSPSALAHDLPQLDARQLLAFQTGATDTMRNAAQAGPKSTRRLADKLSEGDFMRQKLDQIYGPAKAAEIVKRGETEKVFAETGNEVMRGSQTAQRLASLGDEFALGTVPTSPLSLVKMLAEQYQKVRAPSEAVRSRLADMLANPNAAMNAETLALVEAMLKKQATTRSLSSGVAGDIGGSFARP
jgi:hypothetical protein